MNSPVLIVHGANGYPTENWFSWLRDELNARDYNAIVPQFPLGDQQTLDTWLETSRQYAEYLTPDSVLVGHSLGAPFVLRLLERYPVRAAYLVAGYAELCCNEFDTINESFIGNGFDWQAIYDHCKQITVFHSQTDPYISQDAAIRLATRTNAKLEWFPEAGHFNTATGYTTFPKLRDAILAEEHTNR